MTVGSVQGQSPSRHRRLGCQLRVEHRFEIDPTTDTVLGSGGEELSTPIGLVFDGNDMWVTNEGTNTVSKLRAS